LSSLDISDRSATLDIVAGLRCKLRQGESLSRAAPLPLVSTGSRVLDRLLPAPGLRPGSLVEYLATGDCGCGAGTLALAAAREACRERRALVVVDRQKRFYPPAAAAWGINLAETIVLQPADAAEELWGMDQALRCGAVGAVWAACEEIDGRDFRRLQLAAEQGGTLGILVRPARFRKQPSWADVRWLVELRPSSKNWRLSVELLRCRGTSSGQVVQLELDESTFTWQAAGNQHAAHPLSSPAELAGPAAARRSSRA
jgi:protein ImuA